MSDSLPHWNSSDIQEIRHHWQRLIDAVTWEELRCPQIGQLPRLRRRAMDLGERLRSLVADKTWIPTPRDRVKTALATALAAEEALREVQTLLQGLEDNAAARITAQISEGLAQAVRQRLEPRKQLWTDWLDRQSGTSPPV